MTYASIIIWLVFKFIPRIQYNIFISQDDTIDLSYMNENIVK